jgi:tetratricopeptide (TPR) repeat protein
MRIRFLAAAVVTAAAGVIVTTAGAPASQLRPEATSLLGTPLLAPPVAEAARANMEAQLAEAVRALEKAPADAGALIWLGRRTAYLGRFREAIGIFTNGIAAHPADPRFYRHRGHRYLTVREIDRAIADLEKAASLMAGRPDEIEPDGQPNARNIPTSSLHSNVWYHLALGHYVKGDYGRAAAAWQRARDAGKNPDNLVSASHWLYLSLRRAGRPDEARAVLTPIRADLDVIENGSYHSLLLMYKGEKSPDDLLLSVAEGAPGSAVRYGVGAWHLIEGRTAEARHIFQTIVHGQDWPSFGFLAAEAELARGK